jgi:hypothetical protein
VGEERLAFGAGAEELCVGEVVASEGTVGVGEIERDPAHVFTAWNVSKSGAQNGALIAFDDLRERLFLWSTIILTKHC